LITVVPAGSHLESIMMRIVLAAFLFAAPASAYVAPAARASAVSRSAVASRAHAVAALTKTPNSEAGLVIKQESKQTITEDEVYAAQRAWADGVVAIGKAHMEGGDYIGLATGAASSLYAYDYDAVLFKPTRCVDQQFRPTPENALSYFVGGKNVGDIGISEDGGFAIQPWSKVRFNNHAVNCNGPTAIAMGNYFFTDAKTGDISKVEYTFGYRKFDDGNVRIFLHHSSVPYKKPGSAPAAASASASASGDKHIHIYL